MGLPRVEDEGCPGGGGDVRVRHLRTHDDVCVVRGGKLS